MTGPPSALEAWLDQYAADDTDPGDDGEAAAEPVYGSLAEWVALWLAQVVERRVRTSEGGADTRSPLRWCASWWRHPEVVDRLTGLWHTWEAARQDPTGMAAWWRDFFDPCWSVLTHELGPVSRCSADRCAGPTPPLPVTTPPPEWDPPTH